MNILVTGGAGYIGSVTTELLLEKGHNVIVIDDLRNGNRNAVLEPAIFYEGNFGEKLLLSDIFHKHNIDVVMHFAADANIPFSIRHPEIVFKNNVKHGMNLLEMMKAFECFDFIFSSSAAVYGEPVTLPISEQHPVNPVNAYGETKLMFERMLYWYHRAYNFRVNCFRYFNAAGASEKLGENRRNESHLIPLAIDAALNGSRFHIFGNDYPTKDGTCVRDFVHVLDIARAHVIALDNLGRPYEIYNLGNNRPYSVLDVIKTVEHVTGKPIDRVFSGRREGDPDTLIASYEKAKMELGWEPEFSLEEMVESCLRFRELDNRC